MHACSMTQWKPQNQQKKVCHILRRTCMSIYSSVCWQNTWVEDSGSENKFLGTNLWTFQFVSMMCLWRAVGHRNFCAYSNHRPGNTGKVAAAVLQVQAAFVCPALHPSPHYGREGNLIFSALRFYTVWQEFWWAFACMYVSSGTICSISVCWCPVALNSLNSIECICMNFWLLTFLLFLTLNISLGRQRTVISVFWALLQQELFSGKKSTCRGQGQECICCWAHNCSKTPGAVSTLDLPICCSAMLSPLLGEMESEWMGLSILLRVSRLLRC